MKPGGIGAPIDRIDARKKVTGTATYAADVPVAKVAHAVIVTSAIARGRISSLDVAAAQRAPGVISVITHETAPKVAAGPKDKDTPRPNERNLQLLQDGAIHYSDQPIAVVVADTLERAQEAAALVTPRYQAESPIADMVSALGSAYAPKTAGPHGPASTSRGNVDEALAGAATKLTVTYTTPVEQHNPMEPHATTAVWQGNDRLTVYDATQGIFGVRQRLAEVFGIPKENIRVINQFVGGGFGGKGTPWSHVALSALAAKVTGRPMKLVITRPQMFSIVGHRPKTIQTIALGCDAHGKLAAIRHEVTSETSRIDEFCEPSALQTRMLYDCPNVETAHRLVRVDGPTPTFQRAPGLSTGTFAIESAMDELAFAAKIDPLELRLRNYATRDLNENKPFSSKGLRDCYRIAADKFGWSRRTPAPRSMRDGNELVGFGMATATYPSHAGLGSVTARARIKPDGSVIVQVGTQDLGTGTYTVMTQIAADTLGIPIDRVTFELGDTALPEAPASGGSTTASTVGPVVREACLALQKKLDSMSLAERTGADVVVEVQPEPSKRREKYSCHAWGACFVEVRVDETLGRVRVARIDGAYAAGKFLNPKTARSQLLGGIVWALGMALQENVVRDRRTARVVTRDLADYHVPVHADMPAIEISLVDEVDPHVNALGIKGIGELGITGANAAIANAVYHATGKRIRDLPITVDKLL